MFENRMSVDPADAMAVMVRHTENSARDEGVAMPGGPEAPEDGVGRTGMDRTRMEQVQEIRERLERDDYRIDADAVAEAIMKRLCDGRALPTAVQRPR